MSILYQAFGFVLLQIYNVVQNYGIAIILFTILVKLCILPLNIKQTKSMKEMQALQPELQKLQKRYKNNPDKLNQETMKLYKLYNVSPMAGCLPLLLQLPVIYGLFGVLRDPSQWVFMNGGGDAVTQQFLWLPSLSDADPLFILPILCVVFTFITQKFMMTAQGNGDPAQEKTQKMMLYFMPLMIGFAAIKMPAGVALYWVVQNIFTFFQQFFMMRKPVEKLNPEEVERKLAEAKKQEKKDKIEQRKQQSEARADAMAAQQGKAPKKKESASTKNKKPMTKPASKKRVQQHKTITKIPQRDDSQDNK